MPNIDEDHFLLLWFTETKVLNDYMIPLIALKFHLLLLSSYLKCFVIFYLLDHVQFLLLKYVFFPVMHLHVLYSLVSLTLLQ